MDDREPKTEEAAAQQATSTDKNTMKPNKYLGCVVGGKKLAEYNRRVREQKKKKSGSKQSEDSKDSGPEVQKTVFWRSKDFTILEMFSRFTMNAIKSAAVSAIIKTALIFYLSDIEAEPKDSDLEEAELHRKFHDEYLASIFENNDADK